MARQRARAPEPRDDLRPVLRRGRGRRRGPPGLPGRPGLRALRRRRPRRRARRPWPRRRARGGAGDPAAALREALAREVAAAVAGGPSALVPLGKWLGEDLVLAADRIAAGGARRGAELLGLADTTYRRQLRAAAARRASGVALRSATWTAVAALLEDVIHARPVKTDLCAWAEAALLAQIETAVSGDARKAAALLGVTEPTLHRRRADLLRQF